MRLRVKKQSEREGKVGHLNFPKVATRAKGRLREKEAQTK